jgi:acetylornithine deacetylase
MFERLSESFDCELTIHSDRLVPVETAESEPIVGAVLQALPESKPAGSPAMSDMVFLADVPCVKIGPGSPSRSHTPDEYVTTDELAAGASAYGRIIRTYFDIAGKANEASTGRERIDA